MLYRASIHCIGLTPASQLGRLLVVPVESESKLSEGDDEEEDNPLLLLALNASATASWDVMERKVSLSACFVSLSVLTLRLVP